MINYLNCKVKKLHKDAVIPKYATEGSVGFDLHALKSTTVYPGFLLMIHTGLSFSIPEGFEMQVRQRSGLSLKFPSYIAIGVGTIDSDYRGEIMVPIQNNTHKNFEINAGDRIAQAIISPVYIAKFIVVDELDETKRGVGGYGHTG
jgi:dUTP pyrophosphatase